MLLLRVRKVLNSGLPQPQPVLHQPGCCLKQRPIILNRRVSLAQLLEGKHMGPTLQQGVKTVVAELSFHVPRCKDGHQAFELASEAPKAFMGLALFLIGFSPRR